MQFFADVNELYYTVVQFFHIVLSSHSSRNICVCLEIIVSDVEQHVQHN